MHTKRTKGSTSGVMPEPLLPLPDDGFLRLKQVLSVYPVSASTLWKRIRAGEFPAPYSLGYRAVGWDAKEVREALQKFKAPERKVQNPTIGSARAALTAKRKMEAEQRARESNQLQEALERISHLEQQVPTTEGKRGDD